MLVIGGARSGKSRYAEEIAARSGRPVTYVATAGPPRDEEMKARIAAHRVRRPANWVTVEAPLDLARTVPGEGVLLMDCLTLWLTNVMLGEHDIAAHRAALADALEARTRDVIAVANEVGEGIVPATPLGRAFRDEQGILNQEMARRATTVVKMVAGCPLVVKPAPDPAIVL
ncbi:bifunctional adenosylcobinamide kinase/adenosylcobinamide-phosphate guanylyltransferase [Acuticoccus sediminis]|uniref:bifunctional adenosylcobinamide kinase/adenosylcobinamide-phosphate guanylyltransferase n=1 Tax=Acuticoccus sediminis TaxID=2184697 RepID=UPI00299F367C|nr:bifunctional adenosylcobinamide kinase/adenosylcobinamide-phosphate guanylyltransferase [Acuticoccus sediminis]